MTSTPEPTISQFDLADQAERHRVAQWERETAAAAQAAKDDRHAKRIEYGGYTALALVAAIAVCALFYGWWLAVRGPSARDTLDHQTQLACIDKGGTWTKLGDDTRRTCVFMKETQP